MARISNERKQSILNKLLPPHNKSVAEVATEEGISTTTLYNWRTQMKREGEPVPGKKTNTEQWSAEAKFATVVATAAMSEAELSQYCREKGLYVDQVKRWKGECLNGFQVSSEVAKEVKQNSKSDKAQIKRLKAELRHKEKALAEAAALLVLSKKLEAFQVEGEPES